LFVIRTSRCAEVGAGFWRVGMINSYHSSDGEILLLPKRFVGEQTDDDDHEHDRDHLIHGV
jgi:hypothetical protein